MSNPSVQWACAPSNMMEELWTQGEWHMPVGIGCRGFRPCLSMLRAPGAWFCLEFLTLGLLWN